MKISKSITKLLFDIFSLQKILFLCKQHHQATIIVSNRKIFVFIYGFLKLQPTIALKLDGRK